MIETSRDPGLPPIFYDTSYDQAKTTETSSDKKNTAIKLNAKRSSPTNQKMKIKSKQTKINLKFKVKSIKNVKNKKRSKQSTKLSMKLTKNKLAHKTMPKNLNQKINS